MDLPIDQFRLLGVSATTDAQNVLRTLEQRLDRLPHPGFTAETLEARAALLRSCADLLCDDERRGRYGAELTALGAADQGVQAGIEVPAGQELAGLLLLLEADLPLEVFPLVERALHPPQAPALGSGREADLCLLAGLAAQAGADELCRQRHYEGAAALLQQGLQLLQRMGQQEEQRQQIREALAALRPYRVLDLLSRDLGAREARAEGLRLLEELVQERGGLEGSGDLQLSDGEFQAFFRQIRTYLTVQEQIDLFDRWALQEGGAGTAAFLATTALTASGFAQRKPERIAAARDRLLARGQSDMQPLLACLELLLGQVEAAESAFRQGASPELQRWAEQAGDDPLAQLCAYCRDWLARDVLPGYRDLDADADLEAYFADRDVQAYIDRLEPSAAAGEESFVPSFAGPEGELPPPLASPSTGDPQDQDRDTPGEDGEPARFRLGLGPLPAWLRRPGALLALVGALALVGSTASLLLRRQTPSPPPEALVVEPAPDGSTNGSTDGAPPTGDSSAAPGRAETPAAAPEVPLTAPAPTAAQVQALLETWLAAKAAVLAAEERSGGPPLEQLARPAQLQALTSERRSDAAANQTQRIEAEITALELESSSPNRIAALVTLRYSGQRLDSAGQAVGNPSRLEALRNRYVFGRDGETWRLVSFERVP